MLRQNCTLLSIFCYFCEMIETRGSNHMCPLVPACILFASFHPLHPFLLFVLVYGLYVFSTAMDWLVSFKACVSVRQLKGGVIMLCIDSHPSYLYVPFASFIPTCTCSCPLVPSHTLLVCLYLLAPFVPTCNCLDLFVPFETDVTFVRQLKQRVSTLCISTQTTH